jgi:FkbM family methyltransferase
MQRIGPKFSSFFQSTRNLLRWQREERNYLRHRSNVLNPNNEIVEKFFRGRFDGFYVDIGAGRPISNSLTYSLYETGWTGICVDPLRENRILHKMFRPRDVFISSLVGKGPKIVTFFHLKHWSYSTTSEQVASRLIASGTAKLVKETLVQQVPLSYFTKNIPAKKDLFLKIDVEGSDLDVLKTNDWQSFKPNLICVETWENKSDAISMFLTERGYAVIAKTDDNTFFQLPLCHMNELDGKT